jgi:hypothetical protein
MKLKVPVLRDLSKVQKLKVPVLGDLSKVQTLSNYESLRT